jgi:hypothetical protein
LARARMRSICQAGADLPRRIELRRDPLLAKLDQAQRDTRTHRAPGPRARGH